LEEVEEDIEEIQEDVEGLEGEVEDITEDIAEDDSFDKHTRDALTAISNSLKKLEQDLDNLRKTG
jgi:peptidoglycan hydrolase CwlO-like protein